MSAVSDACLVCGGTMVREVFAQNGYRVVACAHCGFEFVYPTPTVAQLAAYYDQSYAVPLARDANNVARHRAAPNWSAGCQNAGDCWKLAAPTAMLVEPIEAAGLGDELICYAPREVVCCAPNCF